MMIEGMPYFLMSNPMARFSIRSIPLTSLKKLCYDMRRKDLKGNLIQVKEPHQVWKFAGRVRQLETLEDCCPLEPASYVLVLDFLALTKKLHWGGVEDIFAFVVLYGEDIYLLEQETM